MNSSLGKMSEMEAIFAYDAVVPSSGHFFQFQEFNSRSRELGASDRAKMKLGYLS